MNAVLERPVTAKTRTLNPQRMALAEQWRQDWVVNAEEGTTIEEVLDPSYWAHMAAHLQQFDRIEVRMETGQWVAELITKQVGRNWAAVHLVVKHDLEASQDLTPDTAKKHEVVWRGSQHKHCVVRLADKEILQSGISSKTEAQAWLDNYERTISVS